MQHKIVNRTRLINRNLNFVDAIMSVYCIGTHEIIRDVSISDPRKGYLKLNFYAINIRNIFAFGPVEIKLFNLRVPCSSVRWFFRLNLHGFGGFIGR